MELAAQEQLEREIARLENEIHFLKSELKDRHELEEHRELQQAVLNREADLAVELLKKHFTVTSEIVLASGRFD